MNFLAVLIVVFFYRHWVGDNPVRPLVPFERYQSLLARASLARDIKYLITVGLPALILWLVWFVTSDWLAGLLWLLICIAVLVYAIEVHDHETDFEKQVRWLRSVTEQDEHTGLVEQQQDFRSRITYDSFRGLYPALFWFLALGPPGVLVYAFSRDYLHGHDATDGLAVRVVFWMEWIPARVTGFIYALLGDFGRCFGQWLRLLPDTSTPVNTTIDILAKSALPDNDDYGDDTVTFQSVAEREIDELRQLLDRTLWGWVGFAAIMTVIGW